MVRSARHLLSMFMMMVMLVSYSTAAAAAICRHASLQEHAAALASRDPAVSVASHAEESAAATDSKKSSTSGSGHQFAAPDFMPSAEIRVAPAPRAALLPAPASELALASEAPPPLLQPPAA